MATIDSARLRETPLTNEEIIALTIYILNQDIIQDEHLQILNDKYDLSVDPRSLSLEVLSDREHFTVSMLHRLYSALHQSFETLIVDLIHTYQQDTDAVVYVRLLEDIFAPELDYTLLGELIKFIDESGMNGPGAIGVKNHLEAIYSRVAPYAGIPEYVKDFGVKVNELPHLEEPRITPDMSAELIADYIAIDRSYMDLHIEEGEEESAKKVLVDYIEKLEPTARAELVHKFSIDPREIIDLRVHAGIFRVYGPCNAYADTDWSVLVDENGDPDVNKIFGGSRMFTDMEAEYDFDNDLPLEDWFVGYCLQCNLRIRAYHHAVRIPFITGGWQGCYCSWACVRQALELDVLEATDQTTRVMAQLAIIRLIEEDIKTHGIQDRDYEVLEAEEEEFNIDRINDLRSKVPVFN